jgi:hypothetical protein
VANLTPNIWYVAYYDPDATFKTVEVKFGAGEKMDVAHPFRPFSAAGENEILDRSKLRVDSVKALKIAAEQPLLKALTLTASKMSLEHGDEGPVWKVELWAAKLKNPRDDTSIGVVTLSASDGSVVKSDLHPDRVE